MKLNSKLIKEVSIFSLAVLTLIIASFGCGRGATGNPGAQGPRGEQGSQGIPGPTYSPIQLCPGFVPLYPSVFPEYGVCINNELYGVYSANGGFLTKILQGTWTSNGINASCTLTVGPNCAVSN